MTPASSRPIFAADFRPLAVARKGWEAYRGVPFTLEQAIERFRSAAPGTWEERRLNKLDRSWEVVVNLPDLVLTFILLKNENGQFSRLRGAMFQRVGPSG